MSLNIEQARFNMIEQQVRTWDVLDLRVLDVLRAVPREDYVPSRYRRMAFADLRLPLAMGQVMMKPIEEGRMLQALDVEPEHTVLEIGTGTGFTAACLAALGAKVLSIDCIRSWPTRPPRAWNDSASTRSRCAARTHWPGISSRVDALTGSWSRHRPAGFPSACSSGSAPAGACFSCAATARRWRRSVCIATAKTGGRPIACSKPICLAWPVPKMRLPLNSDGLASTACF